MVGFEPGNRVIAALDVASRRDADRLVEQLAGEAAWLKLGLELFCACGPELVRSYTSAGHRLMLDLKLHDIPETVARAIRPLAGLGAGLITVHAAGGRAMLGAAVAAAAGSGATILAVTVLTSLDVADLQAVGYQGPVEDLVVRRAQLAIAAGCGGVVASPHETARLRATLGSAPLIVTPGVRPAGAPLGDQKRVMTPEAARAAGADLVVVGRPLRDAPDPAAAARAIAQAMAEVGA